VPKEVVDAKHDANADADVKADIIRVQNLKHIAEIISQLERIVKITIKKG
jgi:hypothetical protein